MNADAVDIEDIHCSRPSAAHNEQKKSTQRRNIMGAEHEQEVKRCAALSEEDWKEVLQSRHFLTRCLRTRGMDGEKIE